MLVKSIARSSKQTLNKKEITKDGKQYTINLNNQSATTAGTTSTTATYGSPIPSITPPTKTNYTFGGYYTGINGTGTQYINSDGTSVRTWDLTSETTLYAHWTLSIVPITATYDSEGGTTCSPATKSVTPNSIYGTLCTPTKTGYDFEGWYTEDNGTGTQITSSSTVTATTNHTLYAKWIGRWYIIELDKQGATTVGTINTVAQYGEEILSITPPTKTNALFGGYYTGINATDTKYINSDGTSARTWNLTSEETTLYASWIYIITLDNQGATTTGTTSTTVTYGSLIPSITPPTKTNALFVGYYTGINATGTQYIHSNGNGARAWDLTTSETLYASWIYKIIFDKQGGTGGNNNAWVYSGSSPSQETYDEWMTGVTKTGFTLVGWYTAASCGGTQITTTTVFNEPITIYACWA